MSAAETGRLAQAILFARAILLDQQGRGQDGAFVSTEALPAVQAFPSAADASLAIMGSIKHFRIVMLAVRTPHIWVSPLLERLLPPYMGLLALRPRTYGYL